MKFCTQNNLNGRCNDVFQRIDFPVEGKGEDVYSRQMSGLTGPVAVILQPNRGNYFLQPDKLSLIHFEMGGINK